MHKLQAHQNKKEAVQRIHFNEVTGEEESVPNVTNIMKTDPAIKTLDIEDNGKVFIE